MIAPKRIDLFCEILQALQPVFVVVAGGPTMMAAFLVSQGADPTALLHLNLPWWVVPIGAIFAYIDAAILKMCYPGVQLPTTANTTTTTSNSTTTTVKTPELPGHPATTISVSTPIPPVVTPIQGEVKS